MVDHYSRHKAALPSGSCLKQYSVEQVLGVGGFGVTYLATDGDLQAQVAIKEYLPAQFAVRGGKDVYPKSPESQNAFQWGLSRFLQEGRELAKFRHDNIVRVHQMFEANNTAYMVLDYEDGNTLENWLRSLVRKPKEEELRDILIPLLGALERIHQGGLLHRDISPDNIIIRKNGEPVLIDFGSARHSTAAQSKTLSTLIKAGYSPPEQYSARGRQGAYTDIYALAATLYRAIMGEKPPEGSWRVAEVAGEDGDPLPPLQEAGYSADFLSAIEAALAVSASRRPQSIAEWRQMFNFFSEEERQSSRSTAHGNDFFGKNNTGENKKQNDSASFSEPLDANAQYELGKKYYHGNGVEQSYEEGVKWYQKAAEQGHADAQNSLGDAYKKGKGIRIDFGEAEWWFRRAAEQGHADAQFKFALMSNNSNPSMRKDSLKWYLKSAEQGHAEAQFYLGVFYFEGWDVEQSYEESAKWYRKAAEQGHAEAQNCLGGLYSSGYLGDYSVGPVSIEDRQKGIKWFRKAAEQGNTNAYCNLGETYHYGFGVKQDDEEAVKWYQKAADQGNALAKERIDLLRKNKQKAE